MKTSEFRYVVRKIYSYGKDNARRYDRPYVVSVSAVKAIVKDWYDDVGTNGTVEGAMTYREFLENLEVDGEDRVWYERCDVFEFDEATREGLEITELESYKFTELRRLQASIKDLEGLV